MATVVQQKSGSGAASAATSVTVTLTSLPTQGNRLIVLLGSDGNGAASNWSVSGGGVTSWNQDKFQQDTVNGNGGVAGIWSGVVGASPSTSITITTTWNNFQDYQVTVLEVSGTSDLDQAAGAQSTLNNFTTTFTCPSITPTNKNEFFVAVGGGWATSPASCTGVDSGYTAVGATGKESLGGLLQSSDALAHSTTITSSHAVPWVAVSAAYTTGKSYPTLTTPVGWLLALNLMAGTTNLGAADAACTWAGIALKSMDTLGALNIGAGNGNDPSKWRNLAAVCNQIAGTTNLEPLAALNTLFGVTNP
jgi:hypothetical protein